VRRGGRESAVGRGRWWQAGLAVGGCGGEPDFEVAAVAAAAFLPSPFSPVAEALSPPPPICSDKERDRGLSKFRPCPRVPVK
jgi:hypothetical protein